MNRAKYRKQWRKQQRAYERYSYRQFKSVFRLWGKSIPFEDMTRYNYQAILVMHVNTDAMIDTYSDVWHRVGLLHGKRVQRSINNQTKNATPETFMEAVSEYLRKNGLYNVQTIKETYISDIIKILERELEGEFNMPEVIKRIQRIVNSNRFYRWQAMRIARTESTAAANYAATVAGGSSVYLMRKVWISVQDSRTRRVPPDRYDHYHMNDETTEQDGKFNVSGEMLAFPGDKENSTPGNTINCRCTVAYEPVRDEDGFLIRIK